MVNRKAKKNRENKRKRITSLAKITPFVTQIVEHEEHKNETERVT